MPGTSSYSRIGVTEDYTYSGSHGRITDVRPGRVLVEPDLNYSGRRFIHKL